MARLLARPRGRMELVWEDGGHMVGRDRAINQEINMLRIPARDSGARIRLLLESLQRERAERC
jgi:hypothetical protein